MNGDVLKMLGLLIAILYVLVREIIAPLLRKYVFKNGKSTNPKMINLAFRNPGKMSLDAFCQHMMDFKENQEKWNEKQEKKLRELDDRLDILEKGR